MVAERFDISGFYSHRQLLLGVRGSSWAQNQASLNGLSVTHASGDGMLVFPDLTTLEAIVFTVGYSPTQHTGAGAHLALLPKSRRARASWPDGDVFSMRRAAKHQCVGSLSFLPDHGFR